MNVSKWESTNGILPRTLLILSVVFVLIAKPAYTGDALLHSESGAYFELITRPPPVKKNDVSWAEAVRMASKRTLNGRQGRLAVINTSAKHKFIVQNFRILRPTWIGLRYWCRYRKMMWVNGKIHSFQSFQVWGRPWHLTEIRCGRNEIPYMPVFYTTQNRWKASGNAKRFMAYLVEYPPTDELAQDNQ